MDTPLKRFWGLLSLDRNDILLISVYAFFAGVINLSIPLGVQAIINLIALGQSSTSWVILTFVVAIGTGMAGTLNLLQYVITESIQQRTFTRSSFEFAYRIPRLQMESITDQYAPELVNRFFDTLTLQKGMSKILVDLPAALLQVLFGLTLLALYHPFFVAFGAVLVLLIVIVIVATYNPGLSASLMESKYKYKVAYWLEELGRTMGSFKLAGRTQLPLEKADGLITGYLKHRVKHFNIYRAQMISIIVLKTVATAALLLIGGLLVINNEMNIGQFVASEIVIIMILSSVEKIIMSMETLFDTLTATEKLGGVTDLPLESDSGIDFKEIETDQGIEINIQNLTYSTDGDYNQNILENINLAIAAGERVCITGMSASGKTTLLRIIMGWYDNISKGTIMYNNIPRKNINIASLRSYIGEYVTEEHLFNGTLGENISMGRRDISVNELIAVCYRVGLGGYLQTHPKGLNTMITSDGEHLPQTVIKKIIIARAIIDNPHLVITESLLDGLNTLDKKNTIDLFTSRKERWTLVAVSRNYDLASTCDKIVVLDKGKIIFDGPLSLLKEQPYYEEVLDNIPS
jgi:ABC-type bacteriocin/lantibiotic exporter with double-glycine peptidase domain